ncbi:hypothetical protein CEXT_601271 [Caerostris extrusa]|uniref:Uncharacterized protein n=1 Tax=Caerostris extrusa TaxID=172846 RepID=A0AAV4RVL4_CAEEX|nr:hypothetical protein CEXT_601271 [Caerostris extrusa]
MLLNSLISLCPEDGTRLIIALHHTNEMIGTVPDIFRRHLIGFKVRPTSYPKLVSRIQYELRLEVAPCSQMRTLSIGSEALSCSL